MRKEGSWKYNTVLCFPIGVILAKTKSLIENKISSEICIIVSITCSIVALMLWGYIYRGDTHWQMHTICSLFFVMSLALISYKVEVSSTLFELIGSFSYEYYILQLPVIYFVKETVGINSWSLIFVLIISFMLAFAINKISTCVIRILNACFLIKAGDL